MASRTSVHCFKVSVEIVTAPLIYHTRTLPSLTYCVNLTKTRGMSKMGWVLGFFFGFTAFAAHADGMAITPCGLKGTRQPKRIASCKNVMKEQSVRRGPILLSKELIDTPLGGLNENTTVSWILVSQTAQGEQLWLNSLTKRLYSRARANCLQDSRETFFHRKLKMREATEVEISEAKEHGVLMVLPENGREPRPLCVS